MTANKCQTVTLNKDIVHFFMEILSSYNIKTDNQHINNLDKAMSSLLLQFIVKNEFHRKTF